MPFWFLTELFPVNRHIYIIALSNLGIKSYYFLGLGSILSRMYLIMLGCFYQLYLSISLFPRGVGLFLFVLLHIIILTSSVKPNQRSLKNIQFLDFVLYVKRNFSFWFDTNIIFLRWGWLVWMILFEKSYFWENAKADDGKGKFHWWRLEIRQNETTTFTLSPFFLVE